MIQYAYIYIIYIYVRTPPHKQSIKPFSFKGDDLGTTKIGSPCDSRFHGHRAKHFARDLDLSRPFNMTSFCAPSNTPHTCHLLILHAPYHRHHDQVPTLCFQWPIDIFDRYQAERITFHQIPPSVHGLTLMNIFHHQHIHSKDRLQEGGSHPRSDAGGQNPSRLLRWLGRYQQNSRGDGCHHSWAGRAWPITTSHLPKQRGIQSPLKMLRQYSSTVHGCNLVLHRFNGTVQEKSAFLREYQKILRPHRSCCPQDFVVMVGRRGLLGQLGVEISLGGWGWPKTVPQKGAELSWSFKIEKDPLREIVLYRTTSVSLARGA